MKKGWYIIALLLFICTNNIQAQKKESAYLKKNSVPNKKHFSLNKIY